MKNAGLKKSVISLLFLTIFVSCSKEEIKESNPDIEGTTNLGINTVGNQFYGSLKLGDTYFTTNESIKIASKPMIEKKIIEERYVEAMIKNIKKLGFFVVLREYLAMPHARPEEGAMETGISFLKVNNPVKYGNEDVGPLDGRHDRNWISSDNRFRLHLIF